MIEQIIANAKTLTEEQSTNQYKDKVYNVEGSVGNSILTVVEGDYMVFIRFVDSKYYEHRMMIRDQFNKYKSIQCTDSRFIN